MNALPYVEELRVFCAKVFVARLLQPGREHVRTEMPAEHAQCQMSPEHVSDGGSE